MMTLEQTLTATEDELHNELRIAVNLRSSHLRFGASEQVVSGIEGWIDTLKAEIERRHPAPVTLDETLAATSAEGLVGAIIRLTHQIDTYGRRGNDEKKADLRRQRDIVKAELVGRTVAPASAEVDR